MIDDLNEVVIQANYSFEYKYLCSTLLRGWKLMAAINKSMIVFVEVKQTKNIKRQNKHVKQGSKRERSARIVFRVSIILFCFFFFMKWTRTR